MYSSDLQFDHIILSKNRCLNSFPLENSPEIIGYATFMDNPIIPLKN